MSVRLQTHPPVTRTVCEAGDFAASYLLTWDAEGIECVAALVASGFLFAVPVAGDPTPVLVSYDCSLPEACYRTVVDGTLLMEQSAAGAAPILRLLLSDALVCAVRGALF